MVPEPDTHEPGAGKTAEKPKAEDKPKKKGLHQRPLLLISMGLGVLLVAIAALLWWLHARHFEATNDAFIDTHIVRLVPQIAGRITAVPVADNQLVSVGQPLILLDSADAQTRVAQARAQQAQAQAGVDNAFAQIKVNQANYRQSLADVAAAQAAATKAAQDLARYRNLMAINPAAVAGQQMDQARAAAAQAAAQRDSAAKVAKARAEQVAASQTQVASDRQQVAAARAVLDEAGITLGYNRIVAPIAGHVVQKTAAIGDYVQPGTQLMAIVPLKLWITANFKETQLALMRVGQGVQVKIDACPAGWVRGHVDSIQRGAGQAFGILPPENATGNYVKVVQRVPVKIILDEIPRDCPLGPGMSVEPKVKVR